MKRSTGTRWDTERRPHPVRESGATRDLPFSSDAHLIRVQGVPIQCSAPFPARPDDVCAKLGDRFHARLDQVFLPASSRPIAEIQHVCRHAVSTATYRAVEASRKTRSPLTYSASPTRVPRLTGLCPQSVASPGSRKAEPNTDNIRVPRSGQFRRIAPQFPVWSSE
jgi:hypothetical protein